MTDIKPRFFESENKVLAHLEWEAIRMICFGGSHMSIDDAYPKLERSRTHWTQYYYNNAKDEHHSVKSKISKKHFEQVAQEPFKLKPGKLHQFIANRYGPIVAHKLQSIMDFQGPVDF